VDAIITPEETRELLAFALRVCANYPGPHLGPFVLPPLDAVSAR
jgi:3-methylcrotonyl-CoA carboxylase beta subunit